MVLNVSGLEDLEDTEESGIMGVELENLYDGDMADIPQGPITNPRITNLFSTQRSWRVLRLPGGRAGEEGPGGLRGFSNFMLQIIPGWRGQTIRDSPFRQMVTARMWQQYINNMEPIDDALEIQAPYSPEEMLSLRMFCEEWNNDPGHVQFTRRLANHPSTSASDAVLKGNMVYDLCTGQIQLRTSRGDREGNLPIRLAHDILTSIPFQEYNFYSLNSVHAQEGAAVYEQFLNRYVRLSSTEVAMVEEIEMGVRASGRAYATMSTNITGDPIEAFALMQQTVEAMELGDTMTVRAQLNALLSPPYNMKSMAQQIDVGGTHGGRFVSTDQMRYHRFHANGGNLTTSGTTGNNTPTHAIFAQGRDTSGNLVMWPETQIATGANTHPPLGFYMEANASGTGVERIWEVLMIGTNKHLRIANYDDQAAAMSALVGGFNRRDRQARDDRAPGRPDRDAADRRRGVRGNPVRENFFGKKMDSVPISGKGKFSIVVNDDMIKTLGAYKFLGFIGLAVLGKTYAKKFYANKTEERTLFDVAELVTEHEIRAKNPFKNAKSADKVQQAFKDGGHDVSNGMGIFDSQMAFSNNGKLLNMKALIALETAAFALQDELHKARSNPDMRMTKKESGKVRVNRFGASSTMGRGKFIYVELIPKKRMSFTGKYKGRSKQTQYWDHGKTTVGDGSGLGKVFPGGPSGNKANPDGGYFLKKGLHTRTKTEEPWIIALPRKSFQAFTDSEGRRTIRPKRRKAEADPAWAKFTRHYGVPTYAGEAGKQNLFKIKKADRGAFYDKLRAKPTKR